MSTPVRPSSILPVIACGIGIAMFAAMDGVIKQLSFLIGVYNALLWRSVAGTVMGAALMLAVRPPVPTWTTLRLHILRGIVVSGMTYCFFWALVRLPLAEAVALSFIAPLVALYLAALLLHERVGKDAILASLLGMVGVGVILAGRMGHHHEPDALWGVAAVLVSALLYAGNLIIQKRQAHMSSPVEIAFFQNLIIAIIFLLVAPRFATLPPVDTLGPILLSALLAFASLALIAWGYARSEASRLIPIEYTAFIWSAFTGWIMFDERLTIWTIGGAVLITAGCLITARTKMPEHVATTAV